MCKFIKSETCAISAAVFQQLRLVTLVAAWILGASLSANVFAQNTDELDESEIADALQYMAEIAPEMQSLIAGHLAIYAEEPFSKFRRFDLNGDGHVDGADVSALVGDAPYDAALDLDGDGQVDDVDQWLLGLLVGDGARPGWGFLDFDVDGLVSLADYELVVDGADYLSVFNSDKLDEWKVIRRGASRASLAYQFAFEEYAEPWETVLKSSGLVLRPISTAEELNFRQAPELKHFEGRVIWVVTGNRNTDAKGAVPVNEIRFVIDPETGKERILLDTGRVFSPETRDIFLTPHFVLDAGSGEFLLEIDPDLNLIRKGDLGLDQTQFARLLQFLGRAIVSPVQAQTTPRYQAIFITQLAAQKQEIKQLETQLKAEVNRILGSLEKLRKQAAKDPCKRLDCGSVQSVYLKLLQAEEQARVSARLARAMAEKFNKRWESEIKERSALRKGYYKQDFIVTSQKLLVLTSDILALDFSKAENLVNSLLSSTGIAATTKGAAESLGVSDVGGISLAEVISGAVTSGINVNVGGLSTKHFDVVRNGYARDMKKLRRVYKQVGAKGLPRAMARSKHIAGLVRSLLKAYANKSIRDVEARRAEAKSFVDRASRDMGSTMAAYRATRAFARDMSFMAQRIVGLQDQLKDGITSCLQAGKTKDCIKAYDAKLIAIEANEGTAKRKADVSKIKAEKARDDAEAAFKDAFAQAKSTHRDLVAVRNAPGSSPSGIQSQIDLKKDLLRTADARLSNIRAQEKEFDIDLGASRLQWAQAKLDAQAAINQLGRQLEKAKSKTGPSVEELTRQRTKAWKEVEEVRAQLPDLRKTFHVAEAAKTAATLAYDDARNSAKSEMQDCISKGFVDAGVPATSEASGATPKTTDLFFAKDVAGSALNGLNNAIAKLRLVKPKLVEVEGCKDRASDTSEPAPAEAGSDPSTWGDPSQMVGDWQYVSAVIRLEAQGSEVVGTWLTVGPYFEMFGYSPGEKMLHAHLEQGRLIGEFFHRSYPEGTPIEACPDLFNQWVPINLGTTDDGRNFIGYKERPVIGYEAFTTVLTCKPEFVEQVAVVFSSLVEQSVPTTSGGQEQSSEAFAGLWKGYYGSTIRVTVSGNNVTAIIETAAEQIKGTGYQDGSIFFVGRLENGRLIGETNMPLDWNPKCKGKILNPDFRASVSSDDSQMQIQVEGFSLDNACGMISTGGWHDAVYDRLE